MYRLLKNNVAQWASQDENQMTESSLFLTGAASISEIPTQRVRTFPLQKLRKRQITMHNEIAQLIT
jgi:hypothetical protein